MHTGIEAIDSFVPSETFANLTETDIVSHNSAISQLIQNYRGENARFRIVPSGDSNDHITELRIIGRDKTDPVVVIDQDERKIYRLTLYSNNGGENQNNLNPDNITHVLLFDSVENQPSTLYQRNADGRFDQFNIPQNIVAGLIMEFPVLVLDSDTIQEANRKSNRS